MLLKPDPTSIKTRPSSSTKPPWRSIAKLASVASWASFCNLGNLHGEQSRTEAARGYYDAALAIHREIGNRIGEGVVLDKAVRGISPLRAVRTWPD